MITESNIITLGELFNGKHRTVFEARVPASMLPKLSQAELSKLFDVFHKSVIIGSIPVAPNTQRLSGLSVYPVLGNESLLVQAYMYMLYRCRYSIFWAHYSGYPRTAKQVADFIEKQLSCVAFHNGDGTVSPTVWVPSVYRDEFAKEFYRTFFGCELPNLKIGKRVIKAIKTVPSLREVTKKPQGRINQLFRSVESQFEDRVRERSDDNREDHFCNFEKLKIRVVKAESTFSAQIIAKKMDLGPSEIILPNASLRA